MRKINFTDKNGTFTITNPENYSGLYLPLAGEEGLKSSITPTLGGDSKTDQNHFLLEPVSIENLHNNRGTRILCRVEGKGYCQHVEFQRSRSLINIQTDRMKALWKQA